MKSSSTSFLLWSNRLESCEKAERNSHNHGKNSHRGATPFAAFIFSFRRRRRSFFG